MSMTWEEQKKKEEFLESVAKTEELTNLISKRGEVKKKKQVLDDKLLILMKYNMQRNYTAKIDKAISNLEALLLQQPARVDQKREKLQEEIEELERKLEKKKEQLENTTIENDSYTIYLNGQIESRKEERNQVLEKHKSKEQVAAEHQLEELVKEEEELSRQIKEHMAEINVSSKLKNKVIKTLPKQPVAKDPSKPWRVTKYDPEPIYIGSSDDSKLSLRDSQEELDIRLPIQLTKKYSASYIEAHRRQGLCYTNKKEFEKLPLEQQKACWQLFDEDEIDALKATGYYPSWYNVEKSKKYKDDDEDSGYSTCQDSDDS